jgi:DNA end-binding protein Ku
MLIWPDEVRSPAELAPEPVDLSEQELREAEALRDVIGERDIGEFHDEYREALERLIEAKLEGKELPAAPEQEAPQGKVVDLMAALQESVRKAQASRGESEGKDATIHEMPTAKKSAAGKAAMKPPAKKDTAKKTTRSTTAKKAAAKKSARKRSA